MSGSKVASTTYEKQLVALGRALQQVREAENFDTILHTVLSYLQAEFEYTLVWIGLYQPEAHVLVGQGGITPKGNSPILTQKILLEPGELLEQVIVQKRLIGIPDLQDVPKGGKWQEASQKLNVKGTIMFPIRHREDCLGVAVLGQSIWGIPADSDDKARLSMVLGELGTALYRLETERRYHQSSQPITSLLSLLNIIQPSKSVEERLALLVRETHQTLRGDRTHLYWFSSVDRVFWRWIGQPGDKRQPEPGDVEAWSPTHQKSLGMAAIRRNQHVLPAISLEALDSFKAQLTTTHLVTVSEAESVLQGNTTAAVMDQMGGQSLMAAPIFHQHDLVGFLATTGNDPRLWTDEEKQYMKTVSQLAALMVPLLEPEQTIATIRNDQRLAAEICQAICSQEEWNTVLGRCDQDMQARFGADRLVVIAYNESRETFSIVYQTPMQGRQKQLREPLPALNDMDWSLLDRTQTAIAVEDMNHDLKLMDWHSHFVEVGLQSFLVCPVTLGNPSNGLVIIAHNQPHHWTTQDKSISHVMGQQIGVLLRQWHLNHELEQRQSIHQAIHGSLSTIQKTHNLGEMETASMNRVMDLMEVPLVALVPWKPEQTTTLIPNHLVVSHREGFSVNTDCPIPLATDALIQWALQTDDILSVPVHYLTTETRQWLNGPKIGQILAVALRTDPEHHPLGLLLVADVEGRFWSNYQTEVLEVVGRQLAWSRRYLMLTDKLTTYQETLEQLNWYKHRSLEYLCWTLKNDVKRLNYLNTSINSSGALSSTSTLSSSQATLSSTQESKESIRSQQLLRHMSQLLIDIRPMIRDEQWQFQVLETSVPLVSLLKRAIARVDPLVQSRQLWAKVHNDQNLMIIGDVGKTELVLHEILAEACRRAPKKSGLDIWCRPINSEWLELSITDQGSINPQLLEELHQGRPMDGLATSLLDTPPGLNFTICQAIIHRLGGEFNIYSLDDGRTLSQMTLHIDHRSSP